MGLLKTNGPVMNLTFFKRDALVGGWLRDGENSKAAREFLLPWIYLLLFHQVL